jgi:hypothetical protein
MKWLVVTLFAAAFFASLLWFESAERKFTPSQQTLTAAVALGGWVVVIVLGVAML